MAKSYRLGRKSIFNYFSVTTTLIIVNIITFIIFAILLSIGIDLDYIAIQPANILQGAYLWTFITSMFMHGGILHLFVNMFSLFFVGSLVEKILGPKRFFYFYMVAGLIAGLFFVLSAFAFPEDMHQFAVGASGALFGVVGLLVLLTPNLPVYVMFIPIPIKMKYAGPGILLVLWLLSIAAEIPIGNMAHLGGLIVGIGYGIYLKKRYKRKTRMISKYFS